MTLLVFIEVNSTQLVQFCVFGVIEVTQKERKEKLVLPGTVCNFFYTNLKARKNYEIYFFLSQSST